ncbi:hypothetical protein RND71_037417 [Anisodus tanguticus]|uniref:Uncharacterized protein n=1 Tax=Anisodus tanguticus TaxID=243964 RepID=A0AAE1R3B4_9SOLA|nr:hypothetical protein RND71_037417 [Anisodus tanguticus]
MDPNIENVDNKIENVDNNNENVDNSLRVTLNNVLGIEDNDSLLANGDGGEGEVSEGVSLVVQTHIWTARRNERKDPMSDQDEYEDHATDEDEDMEKE